MMKPTGFLGQPFKKLKTHHEDPGPGPSSSYGAQSAPGNGRSVHSAHRPHIDFSDSDDSDEEEKYVDRAALLREIDADLQSIISRPGPSDDDKKPVVKKEEGAGVAGAGSGYRGGDGALYTLEIFMRDKRSCRSARDRPGKADPRAPVVWDREGAAHAVIPANHKLMLLCTRCAKISIYD